MLSGYQKFSNLRFTLFAKEYADDDSYPDLKEMGYEDLVKKEEVARLWIEKNEDNANIRQARRKYSWIQYYLSIKHPVVVENIPIQEVMDFFSPTTNTTGVDPLE